MKSCLKLIAIGLALGFAGTAAHAMSELASISVTPLWPTNSNPGNTMRYEVRVERLGQGMLEVALSSAALPTGCQVSFETSTVRFTGREPQYQTVIMSVTSDQPTSTDACAFTVTATAQRESITNTNTPCDTARIASPGSTLIRLIPCGAGDMEVRGLGGTAKCYQVESTTDLINPNWTPTGSCTADGNGRFTFIHDSAQSGTPTTRFYRAVCAGTGN
jgi:hypothetical protein